MDLIDRSLEGLCRAGWYRGQIVHVVEEPATPPRYAVSRPQMPAALRAHLERRGFELYDHQAQVLDAWEQGLDVIVATRTASGKSLAYNLVAATELLFDPEACALYLFPTKALARDQLETLVALDADIGLSARPSVYDGDTPTSRRARIRSEARIVVSNPFALHEYLPQAASWKRFLARLELVVVDEAHRYRGVFGSQVALVLRRLQRLCARLGATPRFVLTSGTIANPSEHAAALIGRPVAVVSGRGGAQGRRTVVLWDSARDPERSPPHQAASVCAFLAESHLATLCFTGSRIGTELVASWVASSVPDLKVSPYRAGFTPAERRAIEDRLRWGDLDVVVSTNALELGIDIGGLDAVVLAGYPGTVASTWQQIGRAGRVGQSSLGVIVAGDDPIDQYLVRRPDVIFGAPVERAVVALGNPGVLSGQVLCAAAELPVADDETHRFGASLPEVVRALEREGLVSEVATGYAFSGTFRPAAAVRLDGRGEGSVEVRCEGETVEVLERWRALRQAHPGAILLHRGQRFQISHLDLGAGVAVAEAVSTQEHTEPLVSREFAPGETESERKCGAWKLCLVPILVRQQVTSFRLRRGEDVLATTPLDLPPSDLSTRALVLVPGRPYQEMFDGLEDPLGALHATEHALIHALPLLAMCDRGDAGGFATLHHGWSKGPMCVLYDGYEGGAGVSDLAFERFEELSTIALDMAGSCDCPSGCPRCVYDRSCGSDNEPMDRLGAVELLAEAKRPL